MLLQIFLPYINDTLTRFLNFLPLFDINIYFKPIEQSQSYF